VTPLDRRLLVALAVFSLLGAIFAGVSTYDFAAHLDRQVHAITCSFVPGVGTADSTGVSGCHTAMMSPYSSTGRTLTWGGLPWSLLGFGVFAYLLFRVADLLFGGVAPAASETAYLVAAALLPLLTSVVFFLIAVLKVGAVCKLCIGIYLSSLGVFVLALVLHRRAATVTPLAAPLPWRRWALLFGEGVAFVALPALIYLAAKPAFPANTLGRCGALLHAEDKYNVRIRMSGPVGGVPAVEVLDPLCPACRGFSMRLAASGFEEKLELEMVLFPLDKECNWMVTESLHPGSCAVSEAVLAAGPDAGRVLAWAFDNQAELRELGTKGPGAVYEAISRQFPRLKGSLGKPAVKAQLNRSLRWVVANSLPVVTPQLYVRGQKVCDEDTDLGLEYALTRLLEQQQAQMGEVRR
jgi:uncharacterized membrane protein